ncbi:hypothetical protein ACLOJK_039923 [Asimina triloba]
MATQMSKKRKARKPSKSSHHFSCKSDTLTSNSPDGVFFAELNEVLMRELAEDGYSGVEVRVTPMRTEIIIRATRTQNVLGNIRFWTLDSIEFL